jgi:Complex I intermediate-associated protein 30 (CIA30)
VAIDGSKFKAVNNRDRNFTEVKIDRFQEQLAQSIQRYLDTLETADRTQSVGVEAKTERLQEKIKKLRKRMRELDGLKAQLKCEPDEQLSLTDPDARSMAIPEQEQDGAGGSARRGHGHPRARHPIRVLGPVGGAAQRPCSSGSSISPIRSPSTRGTPPTIVSLGGRSHSSLHLDPAGHAVFEGEVSLEQNCGFASVRSTPGNRGQPDAQACLIELRGDNKLLGSWRRISADLRSGIASSLVDEPYVVPAQQHTVNVPATWRRLTVRWQSRCLVGSRRGWFSPHFPHHKRQRHLEGGVSR